MPHLASKALAVTPGFGHIADMMKNSIKRFYKSVDAVHDETAGGWRVHLDGRAVKTPAKADFVLPAEPVAREIAAEWAAQDEHIVPASMPVMQLAATAIDRVAPNRDAVIAELTGYGRSDLLCYRAEFPEELALRQAQNWQPLLDWARSDLGVDLVVTAGVMPVTQDDAALRALQEKIVPFDDYRLAALHTLTTVSGSVIIGLAVLSRRLAAHEVFDISQIEENYSIEQWGEDAEALARRERLKAELLSAGRFLDLLER